MTILNSSETQSSVYRAIWRWHFCAGLLILPFLVILAITGGLYLFKDEIDRIAYRSVMEVQPQATRLPTSVLVQNAAGVFGGHVLQVTLPDNPAQSIQMTVKTATDETRTAFVDPYTGKVIGSTAYGGIMQIIRKIHSLQYFGFWASCLMEITAGWTIILALSGLYLWWPRGRRGGVISLRGAPRMRVFWRDLHAVTGVIASVVILFLAITGMPWTKVWGRYVQQWTTSAGLGVPKPPVDVLRDWQIGATGKRPGGSAHEHHSHAPEFKADLPWALEKAQVPPSRPADAKHPLSIDAALSVVSKAALPRPFSLALPMGPHGAYVVSYRPPQVEKTRVLYIDQYDGKILGDTGFERYGPAAKTIEWGIAVHQGLEYGPFNRAIMLVGCIAILFLAVSAPIMWWKRRPKGTWALPPAANPRIARGVAMIMVIVGIILPLTGVSMLAAWLGVWLFEKARGRSVQPVKT